MKMKLTRKEDGFSLIELLMTTTAVIATIVTVVVWVVSVLGNSSREKVDATVNEDLWEVSSIVHYWAYTPGVIIPDATITNDNKTVYGEFGNLSDGTTIIVEGSDTPGEYILYGINEDGDIAGSENGGIVYDPSAPITYVSE